VLIFLLAGHETTSTALTFTLDLLGRHPAVVPWVIHRHPGFWDEPGRFDPERFTPEREKAQHHYAWLPFGGGPRGCIGQHFSMLESVVALAMLVRDLEFTAPPTEPRYTNHITLRPTSGVPSRVSARR
jgi:cytochrome P450